MSSQNAEQAYPYFDFHAKDESGISFEHWTDSRSVGMHRHGYYELFLIERGSCRHMYQGTETLLIPGDAVIISPHNAHGFSLSGVSSIYICQFLPEALSRRVLELLQNELLSDQSSRSQRLGEGIFWESLIADREAYYGEAADGDEAENYAVNSSKRGVIHLHSREGAFVTSLFESMFEDYTGEAPFFVLKKQKYAEVILLELYQALRRQNRILLGYTGEKGAAIADVIRYMEEHLTEPLDFEMLAVESGFSTNHFRKLFRDATGLSPVKYLNRLRITKACEYMQKEQRSAREAAELVGFIDMNYFSRMFKQVMGVPPSRL